MDPFIAALNALPTAIRPIALPAVGAVLTMMGVGAVFSIGNQGLRAAIKEHFVWLLFGVVLVFSGVALASSFFGSFAGG